MCLIKNISTQKTLEPDGFTVINCIKYFKKDNANSQTFPKNKKTRYHSLIHFTSQADDQYQTKKGTLQQNYGPIFLINIDVKNYQNINKPNSTTQ